MDWDDLRLFLAIARAGRLTDAARSVGVDATTIGRRLRRLEAALEVTLFEKAQGGHVMTKRGRALLLHAERMEGAALELQRAVGDGGAAAAGLIRVSVSEGFGSQIVAPRLHQFLARFPAIAIDLIASTGFLDPSRREADIAVMLARPKAGPLLTRKLTDYTLGLYAAADHPAAAAGLSDIAALRGHRLIGYVGDLIYAPELRYLAELDARLDATICSSSIVAQAELVRSGAGCGILPCFIADRQPGLVRLLDRQIDIRRSFWLVVHRDVRGIPRIDSFIAWLDALVTDVQPAMLGRARAA